MNILFEGVNGSGKTTVINSLIEQLKNNNEQYEYVADLATDTPLNPILKMMFDDSVFLQLAKNFKTSLFESLVLAADHHYIQEMHREDKGITVYDRDFISVLAYQKDIIKKQYQDSWREFYEPFRKIMLFELKKIDILCYVTIPIEENIRRTEERDRRKFTEEEKEMIISLKKNMEEEIERFCKDNNTRLLVLDGRDPAQKNTQIIMQEIEALKKSYSEQNSFVAEESQSEQQDEEERED